MSLSIFSLIYTSFTSWLGASWIAWTVLFIAMLIIFSTLLRVPYMIVIAVSTLPFLLLGIYSAIQISNWLMFLVLLVVGLVLAISVFKLMSR